MLITDSSRISASVGLSATGDGGDVKIEAQQVTLETGGSISVDTSGAGNGGDIKIEAQQVALEARGIISVDTSGAGNGGDIKIEAQQVALEAGGIISGSTYGEGKGGNITLTDVDMLLITGEDRDGIPSLIDSSVYPSATGNGGYIEIDAQQVTLEANGVISGTTVGQGNGGNLDLIADTLLITQGGIGTKSQNNGGPAGHITITANDNIRLQNASKITTETDGATGGNISITTAGLLHLTDQSEISTSVRANQGNGGNITLQPLFLILDDSTILAQAIEGHGGDINIKTNDIYVFPSAQFPQAANQERLKQAISASSQLGVSGTITVNSPDINVGKNLVVFATSMTDASSKLKQCVAKMLSERSHFYIKRLPARWLVIDDLRASRLLLVSTAPPTAQTTSTRADQSPPQVALLIGCRQELNQESLTNANPTQLF